MIGARSGIQGRSVLVVEADRDILSVIERLFGHFQIKVDCVTSAAASLDRLKTRDYRTMITDLDIPDMDSLELVRKARERSPDLNVVLYSCSSSEQAMQLVFDPKVSDVSDVPRKPCTFGEMLRIVKNATGRTFLLE